MMSEETRRLLRSAAPASATPPDFDRLWLRGRRRRRTLHASTAVVGAAAIAVVGLVVPGLGDDPNDGLEVTERPSDTCPVTSPADASFTPPSAPDPFYTPGDDGAVWHGTQELWTVVRETEGPRRSVWWSHGFDGTQEPQPDIQVVYERLDAPDTDPIVLGSPGTNAYTADQGWFMIAGIRPDEPGCWRETATYRDAQLSVVYLIEEPQDLDGSEPDPDGHEVVAPSPGGVAADLVQGHPVFVVHDEDGSVRVLDAVVRGDAGGAAKVLAWCETSGWFEDLWHGAQFDRRGTWAAGPAPSGMASYEVTHRDDGRIVVGDRRAAPARPPGRSDAIERAGPTCGERTALYAPDHPADPSVLDDLVLHDAPEPTPGLWYPTSERVLGEAPRIPS